ncbi:hypothetical protein ABBQ38_008266 [Trebouxia sp. C0009 RCD-2024]
MPTSSGRADPFNPWLEAHRDTVAYQAASWLGLAVFLPVLRLFLNRFVLKRFARQCLAGGPQHPGQKLSQRQQLESKFCESLWKALVHGSTLCIGIYAVYNEPWLWDKSYFWRDWPHQHFSPRLLFLYKAYFASYASGLLMLVAWDTRRNDFWAMLLHHTATVVLVALSYYLGFLRVGSMIMLLHDPSDIILEVTKMLNYAEWELSSTVMFVVFMLSWFLTRLVYFPFWIVWSTSFEVEAVLGFKPHLYTLFNGLLVTLVVLHIYWFGIICKIALQKVLHGKDMADVREAEQ